jgi:hypothetical protein
LFLPEPLFLPPPVSLLTVAQARASAVFEASPSKRIDDKNKAIVNLWIGRKITKKDLR